MITTKKQGTPLFGHQTYAPSVLIIGSESQNTEGLKTRLENNGCHVQYISHKIDRAIRHQYYDLAIIDIDNYKESAEIYKQLKNNCALGQTPLIVLSSPKTTDVDLGKTLNLQFPVYYVRQDVAAESILLQLVNQIHYMTYRYT